jgi:chromosome segregation ATPase
MTDREEFEQWWDDFHRKTSTRPTAIDGWQAARQRDAARIAELEVRIKSLEKAQEIRAQAIRENAQRAKKAESRIAELESRLISREIELKNKIGDLSLKLAKLIERASVAEAERDRLRKVLEFYATAGPVEMALDVEVIGDRIFGGGKRARNALERR